MQFSWRVVAITACTCAAAGALLQRQFDDKMIQRAKSEQKVVTQNKIVTVVKEVIKPDGTKETETTTTDNSSKTETAKSSLEIIAPMAKTWFVAASAGVRLLERAEPVYSLRVDRQIVGPVWVGGYLNTRQEVGLNLGVLF